MQAFGDIKATETRTRTYVLPKALRDQGVTISSVVGIAATVFPTSKAIDPTPQNLISGLNTIISNPINYYGDVINAGQAVLQNFSNGVLNCLYLVTWTFILSTGETFAEDTLQLISLYVPAAT